MRGSPAAEENEGRQGHFGGESRNPSGQGGSSSGYAASLAYNLPGRLVNAEGHDKLGLVSHEPYSVVAMIVPWNYPMVTLFQKLPYALAAGCSVIVKPSELTAGTALECALLAQKAGIPDGVINVVPAIGDVVGDAICDSSFIDMISFTGSTRVGRFLASRASSKLKRVALELGGKGANIVFADADLDAALAGVVTGFTANQGEECCAAARVFVEASIFDEFLLKLVDMVADLRIGTPDDPDAAIGALIHEQHRTKVLNYIATAQAEGAHLLAGGRAPRQDHLRNGYFIEPTILTGVTPAMTVFREEIFGPVVCVMPFETEDQVVGLVNDLSLRPRQRRVDARTVPSGLGFPQGQEWDRLCERLPGNAATSTCRFGQE